MSLQEAQRLSYSILLSAKDLSTHPRNRVSDLKELQDTISRSIPKLSQMRAVFGTDDGALLLYKLSELALIAVISGMVGEEMRRYSKSHPVTGYRHIEQRFLRDIMRVERKFRKMRILFEEFVERLRLGATSLTVNYMFERANSKIRKFELISTRISGQLISGQIAGAIASTGKSQDLKRIEAPMRKYVWVALLVLVLSVLMETRGLIKYLMPVIIAFLSAARYVYHFKRIRRQGNINFANVERAHLEILNNLIITTTTEEMCTEDIVKNATILLSLIPRFEKAFSVI